MCPNIFYKLYIQGHYNGVQGHSNNIQHHSKNIQG